MYAAFKDDATEAKRGEAADAGPKPTRSGKLETVSGDGGEGGAR